MFSPVLSGPFHPNYSNPNTTVFRLLFLLGSGCVNYYPAQSLVDAERLLLLVLR